MDRLERLRETIDAIDDEILELLNKRAKVVLEVATVKRDTNQDFYSPERERKILERLQGKNPGPFPNDALRVIFREILSASLSLEEPLRVACLGPLATFTHLAALRHFGSSAEFIPVESIKDVFEVVQEGKAAYGVVPIENSNEGVISYTLDMFMDFDLKIAAEIMLEINHNLLSISGEITKIRKVYSHPQAIAQCRRWIERNLPNVTIIDATSTAKAAELASKDDEGAAIASELAAKIYDLRFVERHIEDNKNNYTRFLVVSKEFPPPTGKDKTSVMLSIKDKPGALYEVLAPFKKAKINLTKIESRPSKRKAWEYIFFIDMDGHVDDKKVKKALREIEKDCLFLKVLGSYPRTERNEINTRS
ncbi:MAG: prephenate dehydratase [Nitrospirae bacterium]|nr:prephenate dehydratase [Nitrospirota bacterium]